MDFRQLEYLVELDKSRNFTYASKKLFLTHGALVHFLTKLEQEVGTTLFYREKSGLIPTSTGEIYVRMAKDMLKVYRRYQETLTEEISNVSSSFTIIATPQFAETEFPLINRQFKTQFPETTLRYAFSTDDTFSCEQVVKGAADIVVSFSPCKQQQIQFKGTLVFEKYASEDVLLVLPLNMPLPEGATDSDGISDLSLFQDSGFYCPRYDDLNRIFDIHHFTPEKLLCSTAVSAYHYVKYGDGVGLIAPSGILDHTAVRCVPIKPTITIDYYLVHRVGDTLTKAQKYFCTLCKDRFYEKIHWANPENPPS